jgi:CRISPR/Cas system-associated exonuclease Cas4 (RecB family)
MEAGGLFQLFYRKVASFTQCRKQYWFRYASGFPSPPAVQTPAGIVGTGVHRALKVLCDTDDVECGAHELDVYLRMPSHAPAGPGTEHHRRAFELYARGAAAHTELASEDRHAELNTWAPWPPGGITVQARVDRADQLAPGRWQIIDWKTGAFEPADATDQQLDLAHIAARVSLRIASECEVTAVAWNLRTEERRVRPLRREDAEATLRRMAALGRRIQAATAFPATPSSACGFCEWRDQCPEAATTWDATR